MFCNPPCPQSIVSCILVRSRPAALTILLLYKALDCIESSLEPSYRTGKKFWGDDSFANEGNIVTQYSCRYLSGPQDSLKYWNSYCRILVEQTYGTPVNRWGILWSPIGTSVHKETQTILVCCKLYNFITDRVNENVCKGLSINKDNNVRGESVVHFQDVSDTEVHFSRG